MNDNPSVCDQNWASQHSFNDCKTTNHYIERLDNSLDKWFRLLFCTKEKKVSNDKSEDRCLFVVYLVSLAVNIVYSVLR